MNVRIKENSWLARMAALKLRSDKVAMVIGHTIHLYNTSRKEFLTDSSWVCHELRHVEQYRRFGFTGFLARYLFEAIRKGYQQNCFEVEARQSESDTSLLDSAKFI